MQITLRQLQIFVQTSKSGSTIAAGKKIGLTQSAISASISELEKTLGMPLFDRISKRIFINDHGRAFLPKALELLNSANHLQTTFQSNQPSLLEIGASFSIGNYLLPQYLSKLWKAQNVNLGIEASPLKITVANTTEIANKVANFEIDLGLIEGTAQHPDIRVDRWIEDELVIVGSAQHPLVRALAGKSATYTQLSKVNWLQREPGSGTREILEQELLINLPFIKSSLEFNDHQAIKQSAAEGLGIGCLSKFVVNDYLENGKLVQIKTPKCPIIRHFSILMHKQKQVTPGMRVILDQLGA
ncbi:LysR family transcriptional regulator [Methylophilus sp. 13]|uniref:LysR substrate-binding domain-containing protein n=1 Tax=Methylophilus sp. 13 TaxID=2781018 RepID=UPI00188EA3AE|nr:LysR substrate-binding domain-containing protein [Methylophilus sp. 13]MBF5037922.1 LysR family transcriptional regulator [Methylophilus sp. 13]